MGLGGVVTETVLTPVIYCVLVVVAAPSNSILPVTSQSPADREIEVIFAVVFVVRLTPVPVAVTYSPTLPTFALLLVVVPTMPEVCEGVKLPVDERVVAATGSGVVLPYPAAGGVAKLATTLAVVANCVVLVPAAAVGAAGVPVNVGEAKGA